MMLYQIQRLCKCKWQNWPLLEYRNWVPWWYILLVIGNTEHWAMSWPSYLLPVSFSVDEAHDCRRNKHCWKNEDDHWKKLLCILNHAKQYITYKKIYCHFYTGEI